MREQHLYKKYAQDIEYRKFFSKMPLMQDLSNKENYQEWLNIYPETNKHVWQYKQINWKQRLELWLAANGMLPAARLFQRFLVWQHSIRNFL